MTSPLTSYDIIVGQQDPFGSEIPGSPHWRVKLGGGNLGIVVLKMLLWFDFFPSIG